MSAKRVDLIGSSGFPVGYCSVTDPEVMSTPLDPLEDEVISTPMDKRGAGKGMPGEGYRRREGTAPGRAALWGATEAVDFPPPEGVWGAYPKRFATWALKALQCPASEVLHVCSGALTSSDVGGGLRVDLRGAARPDLRADGRALPFRDASFSGVLIDPPYSVEYAEVLYGTDYPRPSHLLAEAARVVRPGGRVGFLHFLVPSNARTSLRFERVYGVTQGLGYRIRAFTVYVRTPAGLFDGPTAAEVDGPETAPAGARRSTRRDTPRSPAARLTGTDSIRTTNPATPRIESVPERGNGGTSC